MITLNDLSKICSGLAWGKNINPFVDKFEVNAELPFPFYDAIQREMIEMASTAGHLTNSTVAFKFIDITFPNNMVIHIKQSDRIVFEILSKEEKVNTVDGGSLLRPGGGRY